MTEVASLLQPADHRLTTVRHYQAGPPEGLELVEPGETFATTKEEEWVSKKKTEVTNTKQIETRVKRQVVLEDGKVVEDSGPMVTTNTTEDSETQEHHQTELRKLGENGDGVAKNALEGPTAEELESPTSNWVAVPNPEGIVREVKEKRVISREETEESKETEDIQHFGDITDEDFLAAVRTGKQDLRKVLRTTAEGQHVVSTGPRLVHESTKSNKVTDTEDKRELSSILPDGKIVTETQRTTEHEEVKDEELPEGADAKDFHKESSERYLKTRDQEEVDYVADGVKVGHEMRFKTETMEVERHGDGLDEPDFDSLSARDRRRVNGRQPHRYRGVENGVSPLDRKDALTRKPLDFDQEEETRKVETSKWLEHHFGSDSRSSNNSLIDEEEEQPPKTSFFNVTIKSQPSPPVRAETPPQKTYVTATVNGGPGPRVYSPVEPERDRSVPHQSDSYYKGISQWSSQERRQDYNYSNDRRSPTPYIHERPAQIAERIQQRSPIPDYGRGYERDFREVREFQEVRDVRDNFRDNMRENTLRGSTLRESPKRDIVQPTPPQRKRATERRQIERQVVERQSEERSRYTPNGVGSSYTNNSRMNNGRREEPLEEPPPDYSPTNPSPPMIVEKKVVQRTRFAPEPPKQKSGNIIGQSIRKLVGKIRSASAERKAKQRAKRSPSPSYQKGHVIDGNINGRDREHSMENGRQPVQRYYLGEDPFAGSIYGRENKYDGVKPARSSRRPREEELQNGTRSHSTLGRFSKSTGRLVNTSAADQQRNSQTLPRHLSRHEPPTRLEKNGKSNSTINVSIINTVSSNNNGIAPSRTVPLKNEGPAKPARTYKSSLARSKSLNVHSDEYKRPGMYTSNPHLHRLEENHVGLKSPGLISSLSRSQKDLHEETNHTSSGYTSRFSPARNGFSDNTTHHHQQNGHSDSKRVFMKGLKERSPELFKTLRDNDDAPWRTTPTPPTYTSTPLKTVTSQQQRGYNGDIYEPPTRLRDTTAPQSILRRGSNSSTDFSETFHTTTRNDDPHRPSVTNTVKSFSKKTIPGRDGRSLETIESSETKSITKSHYRGGPKYYEADNRGFRGGSPVVIEVRNNYRK